MGVLQNPKHEKFAQFLAKGETADRAYQLAGYKPDRGNAARLTANDSITARVSEILGHAAARTEKTIGGVLEDLERLATKAEEEATPAGYNVARAALMDYAKLRGWNIDRKEIGGPGEFERMSDDELETFVSDAAREIRKDLH